MCCPINTNCSELIEPCACKSGYFGLNCQYFNPCHQNPCYNSGKCQNISYSSLVETRINDSPLQFNPTYFCQCLPGFNGKMCEIPLSCSPEISETTRGTFEWPATVHGYTVTLPCPYNSVIEKKFARRKCILTNDGRAEWQSILYFDCLSEVI